MAIPVRGFGLTLGLGEESTWGTAVARSNWLRLASASLKRQVITEKLNHLGTYGQTSTAHRYNFISREEVGGRISWPLMYNDSSLMLLKHAMGATVDAGAGPYTHTLTLASPPPVGLTMELIKGTHASLSTAQVFEGGKLDNLEIAWEAGQIVQCSADVIAQAAGGITSAGTPSYNSTPYPVIAHQMTTALTIGGNPYQSRSVRLRVSRGLQRNQEIGSLYTSEPFESRLTVELEVEVLWQDSAWHTAHYASTAADVTFAFADSPRALTGTLHNAIPVDVSEPTDSAEGIRQTIRFEAYADSSDQGLSLVFTNANALTTTN